LRGGNASSEIIIICDTATDCREGNIERLRLPLIELGVIMRKLAGGVRPLIGDAVTRETRAIRKEIKNVNMLT
jgi:hypothetical protein